MPAKERLPARLFQETPIHEVCPASEEFLAGPNPELLDVLRKRHGSYLETLTRGRRAVHATTGIGDAEALTEHMDGLVRMLVPDGPRGIDIVALGGYGRRELCPRSDVDLLFLVPDEMAAVIDSAVKQRVESVLYGLWGLRFEVGQAVRTVAETLEVAEREHAELTSLLDARLVLGDPQRFARFRSQIDARFLTGQRAAAFIAAKLGELERRQARFGDSLFLLEPNVKEGRGGLRDLHSALWIARARFKVKGVRDLVRLGVMSSREGETLSRAYSFLLGVRRELHLAAGRKQEHLRFDHQEQIAAVLGYYTSAERDMDKKRHGVERFMRAYYFHAHQLRHHADLVIERATSHRRRRAVMAAAAPGRFKIWDGKLTVADRGQFEEDPSALLRIFRVAQEESREIYSYTKNLVSAFRLRLDRTWRRDPAVVREFFRLLEDPKGDGSILFEMHDLGILRQLLPEVSRMTARWQHSLYHVYTVDIHSIMVVKNLKRLRRGHFAVQLPEMTRLITELPRPHVLYLAGFLHDIGKGWPRQNHSERGARVAETVGRRFEEAGLALWTAAETEDLVWLVLKHLAMSDISQRRDLSDPELLESFAREAGTLERLSMLYVLTFADMKGTSDRVWTQWKGRLLRRLYRSTAAVLEHLSGGQAEVNLHFQARRRRAEEDLLELAVESRTFLTEDIVRSFVDAMPARYLLSLTSPRMLRHVIMWRDVSTRGDLGVHVRHLRREASTKLTVVCLDQPGLLATLAGTLAANRLLIQEAQVFSVERLAIERGAVTGGPPPDYAYDLMSLEEGVSNRGRVAVDVLYVRGEDEALCDDPKRWEQVKADLREVVRGETTVVKLLEQRRLGSGLGFRHQPAVKTEVVVSNTDSASETIIDVFGRDQLGILYRLAQALADEGLSISLAKISTQGLRIADGFYVTDSITGAKVVEPGRIAGIKTAVRAAWSVDVPDRRPP